MFGNIQGEKSKPKPNDTKKTEKPHDDPGDIQNLEELHKKVDPNYHLDSIEKQYLTTGEKEVFKPEDVLPSFQQKSEKPKPKKATASAFNFKNIFSNKEKKKQIEDDEVKKLTERFSKMSTKKSDIDKSQAIKESLPQNLDPFSLFELIDRNRDEFPKPLAYVT